MTESINVFEFESFIYWSQMDQTTLVYGGAGAAIIAITSLLLWAQKSSSNNSNNDNSNNDNENEFPGGPMTIFFGSQTGTAEGFARTLMEEGRERGFDASIYDLEDFDPEAIKGTKLAVFLMATYGEGEPTDSSTIFYNWLKNEDGSTEDDCLNNVEYTVFGLGNTQYEHYNRMGKMTNKHLSILGGTRIFDYGEGDDDGTLEEDFQNWRDKLWPAMISKYGGTDEDSNIGDHKIKLQFRTKIVSGGSPKSPPVSQINTSTKHFFTSPVATVSVNRELRAESRGSDIGSTRHIEVDLKGTNIKYNTADNLAVLPENDAEIVSALAKSMGYDLNQKVILEASNTATVPFKHMFPNPCTIRDILTKYTDIQGIVRHSAGTHLLPYVTNENQKKWLEKLISKDNRSQYKKEIEDEQLGFAELLCEKGLLSSAQIPFDDFLHIVPMLQPRYYTISSSSNVHKTSIHITVSVTDYELNYKSYITGSKRRFKGVCSSYLAKLKEGSKVSVFVRSSTFKLPETLSVPIIMIGPGTGVAPMRALIQDRSWQGEQETSTKKINSSGHIAGKNILYFGCRNRKHDYIYSDELQEAEKSGKLSKLHLAFSREQNDKIYVQNIITKADNQSEIISDLEKGAYVFVCGATQMGIDVMEAFVKTFMSHYYMTRDEAQNEIKELQRKGRYIQELWTA